MKKITIISCMFLFVCALLHAASSRLTACDFMKQLNVGYNMGNTLDAWHSQLERRGQLNMQQETLWGQRNLTQADFDRVRDAGFNTVRIPVTWWYNTYMDAEGKLQVYHQWLERVKTVIDYALVDNLYVILNTHFDSSSKNEIYVGASKEKMDTVYDNARQLWGVIATYFKNYDHRLIFESYNETAPCPGWFYGHDFCEQMNALNQIFVDTVRATGGNNRHRLLIVPTLLDAVSSDYIADFALPRDPVKNELLVEVHSYDTRLDQSIEPLFCRLEKFSKRVGAPVIIGEFATKVNYAASEYRVCHIRNFVARYKAHGLAGCYWCDGNLGNFGLISRCKHETSGQMNNEMLKGLLTPVAYESTDNTLLNTYDNFEWKTLDDSAEMVDCAKWKNGNYCCITTAQWNAIHMGNKYIDISLNVDGAPRNYVIKKIAFYDADKKKLFFKDYGDRGGSHLMMEIPKNAAYYKLSVSKNWGTCNTTEAEYRKYISEGNLSLTISYLSATPSASLKAIPFSKKR